jgi:hypothetical protein
MQKLRAKNITEQDVIANMLRNQQASEGHSIVMIFIGESSFLIKQNELKTMFVSVDDEIHQSFQPLIAHDQACKEFQIRNQVVQTSLEWILSKRCFIDVITSYEAFPIPPILLFENWCTFERHTMWLQDSTSNSLLSQLALQCKILYLDYKVRKRSKRGLKYFDQSREKFQIEQSVDIFQTKTICSS